MVGEEMDGWKLQSIEPFSALFSSGDQQATLALSIVEISQPQGAEDPESTDEQAAANQKQSDEEKKRKRNAKKKTNAPDRLRLGRGDST